MNLQEDIKRIQEEFSDQIPQGIEIRVLAPTILMGTRKEVN